MTVSRRNFLKGAAAAVSVALIAPSTFSRAFSFESVPILYGDGVHDDTRALQALIDGERVDVRDNASRRVGNQIMLAGGTYKISTPLHFDGRDGQLLFIVGSRFETSSDAPVLHLAAGDSVSFEDESDDE